MRAWLLDSLRERIVTDRPQRGSVAKLAVSTALDKVAEFFGPDSNFRFLELGGGRYSVDSAVGTSLALAPGFADFLAGFNAMGRHR